MNIITSIPTRLVTFIKEVRLEIKRVSWPSREQVTRNTIIVIIFSFIVAVFLGGLDIIFGKLLERFVL